MSKTGERWTAGEERGRGGWTAALERGGQLQRRCLREGSWRRRCELLLRHWREGSARERAAGGGTANCCCVVGERKHEVLGFLMGLGLAWATQGTKSTDLVSHVDD
jgi:hypothetical protein